MLVIKKRYFVLFTGHQNVLLNHSANFFQTHCVCKGKKNQGFRQAKSFQNCSKSEIARMSLEVNSCGVCELLYINTCLKHR